jgi:ABC-type Na+ transport system ATPase subunit NatA
MRMAVDAPLVVVEGLHKRYRADGPEAVAGIDFEVRRGEVFGLLGPKGLRTTGRPNTHMVSMPHNVL